MLEPTAAPPSPTGDLLRGVAYRWHGTLSFAEGHALNLADAAACAEGAAAMVRVFSPDRPVLTLGRRVRDVAAAGLADTVARCEASDVTVIAVDRGGQATLHLPGQIVALVAIPCARTDVAKIVAQLLDGAAAIAQQHGITAQRRDGVDTGLWLGARKLVSVGLRHQAGVVRHGVAINVAIDATLSRRLVLCGHAGAGYADLRAAADTPVLAADTPVLAAVALALASAWGLRPAGDAR